MRLALIGYGKMGKTIHQIALNNKDEIPIIIDKENKDQIHDLVKYNIDAAIEFSNPESAFDNVSFCIKNSIPIVSGTTGWLDRLEEAKALNKKHRSAFMYASNFSIGVNIFFELNQYLAKKMQKYTQFKLEMEEIHHTQKLDAPSGTAITLAEGIIDANNNYRSWVSGTKASHSDVQIVSKREADVPGTHSVKYRSEVDQILIEHTAFSRMGFAQGAYEAARWISKKQGYFDIKDMLFS